MKTIVMFVAGTIVQFAGILAGVVAYRQWTTNHAMAICSAVFAVLFTVYALTAAVMAVSKIRHQT